MVCCGYLFSVFAKGLVEGAILRLVLCQLQLNHGLLHKLTILLLSQESLTKISQELLTKTHFTATKPLVNQWRSV
jgi:hypothetical protein